MNRISRQFRFWHSLYSDLPNNSHVLRKVVKILYKISFENVYNTDVSLDTRVGSNLTIHHGYGLVIHPLSILGDNVVIRHCTTIGERNGYTPVIGNNVDVGCNVVIIGRISIGSNTSIGAGSIVVDSIPENSVVYGGKAKSYSRNRP